MITLNKKTAEETPFRDYCVLLLELDHLIEAGKGDEPEADEIRDRMDAPWNAMSSQERERARGLSADLYLLEEGKPKPGEMTQDEKDKWAQRLKSALASSEIEPLLAILREPFPEDVPGDYVPLLQAYCYAKLGTPEGALRFAKEAERRDGRNSVWVIVLLNEVGDTTEAQRHADRILTK